MAKPPQLDLEKYCPRCRTAIEHFPERCPGCAETLDPPPNVRMAKADAPRLGRAYHGTRSLCGRRRTTAVLNTLEQHVRERSNVVVNMRFTLIRELLESSKVVYGNFWDDFVNERVGPRDPVRVGRRMMVDGVLFGDHARHIRYGTLSCDGTGPPFYGRYAVTLDPRMVEHRVSFIEDNAFNHLDPPDRVAELRRATWKDRARLAAVKYGRRLTTASVPAAVVRPRGAGLDDQDFVEAHIWRGFTAEAFSQVRVVTPARDAGELADDARIEALCLKKSVAYVR
jgi:hypothetical protein